MATKLSTAILTTGTGSLPTITFNVLQKISNLKGVVFSRKKLQNSKLEMGKIYGLWGIMQFVLSIVFNVIFKTRISTYNLKQFNLESTFWIEYNDEQKVLQWLKEKKVDVVIVCSFHHILRPSFFNEFSYCLNIHPSYLPYYRGPEPILWGLADRISKFGVTLHKIDRGIDTGEIIFQSIVEQPFIPVAWLVEKKLSQKLPTILKRTIEGINDNNLKSRPQKSGFYRPVCTQDNRRK